MRSLLAGVALLVAVGAPALAADRPLPSWNDTPRRDAIITYIERITKDGGSYFVPPEDRIAVFDNDGTLWSEQPLYPQIYFIVDRVKELAELNPGWKTQEPFASVLKGDLGAALSGGYEALEALSAGTMANMTTTAFTESVKKWIATAKNPDKDRRFLDMTFQPMLELLDYLRANQFQIYIVSGSDTDFVRAFSVEAYGVEPQYVVGSEPKMRFQFNSGGFNIWRLPEPGFVSDGPGKPVAIENHIGRKPIFAFGNSDGDMEMLQYVCVDPSMTFCGVIHHTDGVREFAYDTAIGMGQLDKMLPAAEVNGWSVVNMKTDWSVVYPPAK
ncbi:HAD family hydrolase [Segnochrobactraceae bacterium EtOH-i3]